MVEKLKVGMKLHAKYTDGQFYAASVEAISMAEKRKKHPVKIAYIGYDESAWKSIGDLRSKALSNNTASKSRLKAHSNSNLATKVWNYAGLESGTRLQAEFEGKYYAAEVITVAKSKARAKAPVKVHWVGYTAASDEWMSGDRLRSKALKQTIDQVGKTDRVTESGNMISITITDVSGMTLWGPKPVDDSWSGGHFSGVVTNELGEHFATDFVIDATVLDTNTSLAAQGVVNGSNVTMVRPSELTKAKALYARLCATLTVKVDTTTEIFNTIVRNCCAVPEMEALELLKNDIPKDLDNEALPEDILAWVQVLLTSGKTISLIDDNFQLEPCLGLDMYGNALERPVAYMGRHMFFSKGLLYLNVLGNLDNVIMHIVDVDGQLGRIFGNGNKGSVWYANAWDQIYDVQNPFTIDCWQRIQNKTAVPAVRLDVSPVCVAASLERFFEALAATGKPPGYEYVRRTRCYAPNVACLWLEGKLPPAFYCFEVKIEKCVNKELGISYHSPDMVVSELLPGGLAEKWNSENPRLAIKPHDKILEVNGKVVDGGPKSGWQDTNDDAVNVLRIKFRRPASRVAW